MLVLQENQLFLLNGAGSRSNARPYGVTMASGPGEELRLLDYPGHSSEISSGTEVENEENNGLFCKLQR